MWPASPFASWYDCDFAPLMSEETRSVWEMRARETVADHDDGRSLTVIVSREVTSCDETNAHRAEVARADDVVPDVRARVVVRSAGYQARTENVGKLGAVGPVDLTGVRIVCDRQCWIPFHAWRTRDNPFRSLAFRHLSRVDDGAMATATVCARSAAEIPVVTPSRASIDSVKAVE